MGLDLQLWLVLYNTYYVQGSVYKKANPRADINQTRDAFWDEQEVSCSIDDFSFVFIRMYIPVHDVDDDDHDI